MITVLFMVEPCKRRAYEAAVQGFGPSSSWGMKCVSSSSDVARDFSGEREKIQVISTRTEEGWKRVRTPLGKTLK